MNTRPLNSSATWAWTMVSTQILMFCAVRPSRKAAIPSGTLAYQAPGKIWNTAEPTRQITIQLRTPSRAPLPEMGQRLDQPGDDDTRPSRLDVVWTKVPAGDAQRQAGTEHITG